MLLLLACESAPVASRVFHGNVTLHGDAQAQAFVDTYDTVAGTLTVDGLQDAGSLQGLTTVEQSFLLHESPELKTLTGLETLTSVDGVVLDSLESLQSLEGLDGLTASQQVYLKALPVLPDLSGLGGLEQLDSLVLDDLPALHSLHGLKQPSLERVNLHTTPLLGSLEGMGPVDTLYLEDVPLEDLRGLPEVRSLQVLRGLRSVDGLENTSIERLYLKDAAVTSVKALSGRTSLEVLILEGSPITEISLPGLQTAGSLQFEDVPLQSLELPELVETGDLVVNSDALIHAQLSQLSTVRNLFQMTTPSLGSLDLPALTSATALWVEAGALQHLDLPNLTTVDDLHLHAPVPDFSLPSLTHCERLFLETGQTILPEVPVLDGLEDVSLAGPALQDISSLSKQEFSDLIIHQTSVSQIPPLLPEVFGDLWVYQNTEVQNTEGLSAVSTVDRLTFQENVRLTGISMPSLVDVRVLRIKDNPALQDLSGLLGLRHLEELTITGNPQLPQSEIDALIAAVGASNIAEMEVSDNAP